MKCHSQLLTITLLLVVLAANSFAADRKQLAAAVAEVDANLKAAVGKQYDETIGHEFSAKYLSSVRQCKQSTSSGKNPSSFDILLKLDTNGKVISALVDPETPLAVCSRTALMDQSFSPPTHADYWVNIHMQFKH